MEWKLAEAKNRFSELVNKALTEGPQHISRREDKVVVISEKEYQQLTGQSPSFIEFLLQGDPNLDDVHFERDRSRPRNVDL